MAREANWFRKRRSELNISSAEQMAQLCFVTVQTVYNWERGISLPQRGQWADCARAYQVSIDDFMAAVGKVGASLVRKGVA